MPNDADATGISTAVDLAQIYGVFSGLIRMAPGNHGFHGGGEGGPVITAGNLAWPTGGLPANMVGRLLPDAYRHRLSLFIEGVRQMARTITCQIVSARVCLVASRCGGDHASAARPGR